MARYKPYSCEGKIQLEVSLKNQLLPGTLEYTINEVVEPELDLSIFESRYHNDATGAPAYHPALLLKIIF